MGGKSSRFPEMRPKWMLTHPSSGSFMCIESIKGINLDFFDNVFFVILKEHDEKYQAKNLCFLCPNCHSQTDTYCGKKNKKFKLPKPIKIPKEEIMKIISRLTSPIIV